MKKFLLGLLLACGFIAKAQVYNNEWIVYSQTYYKFKVAKSGPTRIAQSVLSSAGLGTTPAEQFQLWRNGKQIPIYTSIATGILTNSDFIEFYGEMNDGKPDRELYRKPEWQLNNKWSLETDTATYFLTVNTNVSQNLRLIATVNNVSGNTLPAETYFMYTAGQYYKQRINLGYAVNVGDYLYSSSYDRGEGWSSNDITSGYTNNAPTYGGLVTVFPNLYAYAGGPSSKIKVAVSGNVINQRRFLTKLNSDSVLGNSVDFFNYTVDSANFPTSLFKNNNDSVTIFNYTGCSTAGCPSSDRMVVHQFELTYPRQFNFGGSSNFEFNLQPTAVGNFLQITNFNYGSTPPVLFDLTNGKRYTADLTAAPVLKFALGPSSIERRLVLVSEEGTNISQVTGLQQRNFIDYTAPVNQGDYMIISHPALFSGANGSNPVEDYRAYRNSPAGGNFVTKIYLIDEIYDQFGFGIKRNPAAVRNFLRYARSHYAVVPKHVFIIGKGVDYFHAKSAESNPDMEKLDLIPPYGYPASDILLAAEPGSSLPEVSIGRLSVIYPQEVADYLKKIKDYDLAQVTTSPYVADRGWMKNAVHIVGAGEPGLENLLGTYLDSYSQIIKDTLFGAHVTTFSKSTTSSVEQINSSVLQTLFNEGINIMTYFGHSSSTTLEFNLDNPSNYNNQGKYPMFFALGCNAGNFFNFNTNRFQVKETISEKYVLAPERGTIGFVASTHFGIVHYLDVWASRAYQHISSKSYGKPMGEIMKLTAQSVFNYTTQDDFYARCNIEESELHGDPALRLNPHPKPDYAIESPMVRIIPGFVSVADSTFQFDAKIRNLGVAPNKPIVLEIKRQYPNQSVAVIHRDTIPGIRFMDSISLRIKINPATDKGLNRITITVDPENEVDEMYESNNSITKDVFIYEDEARAVFPYNFSIVNNTIDKFLASTANPFIGSKQYVMELDTTEKFNSPVKITRNATAAGGVIEFNGAGISYVNNRVYYWRVAPVVTTGDTPWNTSSFVYMANSDFGFNQSHYFQNLYSGKKNIVLDSDRQFRYDSIENSLFIKNGVFLTATTQEGDLTLSVNGLPFIRSGCIGNSLLINIFDPHSFAPTRNPTGKYGSSLPCQPSRLYNFEFSYMTPASRKLIMDFMDSIPSGYIVVVRNLLNNLQVGGFVNEWKNDTLLYGSGNSLYHKLKNVGMANIDSFYKVRAFGFIYQKGNSGYTPRYAMSTNEFDLVTLSAEVMTPNNKGELVSPVYGPVKQWKSMFWGGNSQESPSDDVATVSIIGIKNSGKEDTLISGITPSMSQVNISSIDAQVYPYIKLNLKTLDTTNYSPYQLNYWRVTGDQVPEGVIAPNIYYQFKDTVDIAEPIDVKVAFKNVTQIPFDSVKVRMVITDRNNVQHELPVMKLRPMAANDTIHVRYYLDTKVYAGENYLYVDVNPDNDQPEQYHFNNFLYQKLFVRGDTLNPLLDVTFDNVHILNRDVVSSKPNIVIKLKDEAKWFLLNDPSNMEVKVRNVATDITTTYNFGNDTLQFFPAQQAPNTNNTATAVFKPYFMDDGTYELIVSGKDMSGNTAGKLEYRVFFDVINKPMISNMLNYPNPFTTSTAFVFTLTGSEVPQNIRIQILTVTGKIVRDITKEELGPLHIGKNITEYKWDGTDQYGQKLANGVYLYRVITNLNGKSLDKYRSSDDNTDKYFNKGYGKMYLMR